MKPKDAIHLATAARLKLAVLDCYDDDLIALNGKLGNPRIVIGHPAAPQPELPFPEGDTEDDGSDVDQDESPEALPS